MNYFNQVKQYIFKTSPGFEDSLDKEHTKTT